MRHSRHHRASSFVGSSFPALWCRRHARQLDNATIVNYVVSRCFASTSESSSSTRKRRPRTLSSSAGAKTTRERLRTLVERNQTVQVRRQNRDPQTVNQLVNVATQRLSWLKTKVYQHWNPDYQPASNMAGAEKTAGSTINVAKELARRKRPVVVMNGRWWFWNLAFALLPAVVISIYCEFRVKPVMIDFYARQEASQRQRLLHTGTPIENGHHRSGKPQQQQQQQHLHQSGEILNHSQNNNPTLAERFSVMWYEVQSLLSGLTFQDENEDDEPEEANRAAVTTTRYPYPESSVKTLNANRRESNKKNEAAAPLPNATPVDSHVTLRLLVQRIENLERVLQHKHPHPQGKEQEREEERQQQKQRQQHLRLHPQQSGIRGRVEGRMRRELEAETLESNTIPTSPPPAETDQGRAVQSDSNEKGGDWSQKVWSSIVLTWKQLSEQWSEPVASPKTPEPAPIVAVDRKATTDASKPSTDAPSNRTEAEERTAQLAPKDSK